MCLDDVRIDRAKRTKTYSLTNSGGTLVIPANPYRLAVRLTCDNNVRTNLLALGFSPSLGDRINPLLAVVDRTLVTTAGSQYALSQCGCTLHLADVGEILKGPLQIDCNSDIAWVYLIETWLEIDTPMPVDLEKIQ